MMDNVFSATGYDSNITESLLNANKKSAPRKVAAATLGNTGEDFEQMSKEGLGVLSQGRVEISQTIASAIH